MAPTGTSTTITLSDAERGHLRLPRSGGPGASDPAGFAALRRDPGTAEIVGVLGDVDCDGSLTPIDASVVLGLFVGSILQSQLPPPCNTIWKTSWRSAIGISAVTHQPISTPP